MLLYTNMLVCLLWSHSRILIKISSQNGLSEGNRKLGGTLAYCPDGGRKGEDAKRVLRDSRLCRFNTRGVGGGRERHALYRGDRKRHARGRKPARERHLHRDASFGRAETGRRLHSGQKNSLAV